MGNRTSQILTTVGTSRFLHQPRYFTLNRWNMEAAKNNVNKSQIEKEAFKVCLNVKGFAPNEISVKTIDNAVIIEGNHEEQQDSYGYISRCFKRCYVLPMEYNIKDIVSTLSSDGVLTVKAPVDADYLEKETNERVVKIEETGTAFEKKDKAPETPEVKKVEKN